MGILDGDDPSETEWSLLDHLARKHARGSDSRTIAQAEQSWGAPAASGCLLPVVLFVLIVMGVILL
jgi:hypothetical protein